MPTATRALGEGKEDLHSLRIAVMGGSGYLKEYVEAVPLGPPEDYTYPTTDKDGNPTVAHTKSYTYQVTLTLSDSKRTVHFIGNGPETLPFGYDTSILPIQKSANMEMGYWQKIFLPNGIKAKRNANGDFIDKNGEIIPEGGSGFVADDATEDYFHDIPLIRNWAKIVLDADDDSNFTPYSFAVVNVPVRGSIVPYSAATGFITDYHTLSFTDLEDMGYPANLPYGVLFDSSIPSYDAFTGSPLGEGVASADGGAQYLYERPVPSESVPPTYVIMYGHYRNPDDLGHEGDYFYKVDLMDIWSEEIGGEIQLFSRYYPIYRNFKYQVKVRMVLAAGHATPEAAVNSVGSGDVSADITTRQLADISDGFGRLIVSPWMSHTFTREHGDANPAVTDLKVYFSCSPTGEADTRSGSVRVELLPPEDEGSDIIYDLSIDRTPDADGWRSITFKNLGPGRTARSQTIRITGSHDFGRLYRDIVITVQPIQQMKVTCVKRKVSAYKGAPQEVAVSIPDGLVESMFPLKFIVEPEAMTLTPDTETENNNLPVLAGTSISENTPYAGKTAFHFQRSVSWEEYKSLTRTADDEGRLWRTFTCYFKSNCDESSTRVWVYNEFFDKESDAFVTAHDRRFVDVNFTAPVYEEANLLLPVEFTMTHDADDVYPDDFPVISIATAGLNIPDDVLQSQYPNVVKDGNVYLYTPQSADDRHIVLNFMTTTDQPDDISVNLTAERYSPEQLVPVRFPMATFVDGHPLKANAGWSNNTWSNVAWGHVNRDGNKTVVFGYKDHPSKPNPTVTLRLTSGLRDFDNASVTTVTHTPTGPRSVNGDQDYHEIEIRTLQGTADATLTMLANGYVVKHVKAGRFIGNIRTMKANGAYSQSTFTVNNPTFTYAEDNGEITVTFSRITSKTSKVVRFNTGENLEDREYTMTITSNVAGGNFGPQYLFWVDMFFEVSGNTVMAPEMFSPSVGTVTRYWGSNNQYVWAIPSIGNTGGYLTASLTFWAPAGHDVELGTLYVKAIKASLYEGGKVLK